MAHTLLNHAAVYTSIIRVACFTLLAVSSCSSESSPAPHRELTRQPVLGTTRRTTTTLVELQTESEMLVTTPEHPFAAGGRWTRAAELKAGDTIQTARGSTRVLSVHVRPTPPTAVYNLSIAKTHAYFAGSGALLVHNVDCGTSKNEPAAAENRERGKTLADRLAAERQAEQLEREKRQAEQLEQDARELRIRRELAKHRRQLNRLNLNDTPPRTPNCAYCTMAGLDDAAKVTEFAHKHGLNHLKPLDDEGLRRQLQVLGLSHEGSGQAKPFTRLSLEFTFKRMLKRGRDRKDIDPAKEIGGELPAVLAHEYLESLPGNTSMVVYRWVERHESPVGSGNFVTVSGSHAVTAVRTTSGKIIYVDFQDVPPEVYLKLPKTTFDAVVLPTDVDWRYNRQLYAALRDGKYNGSL
jgi:hypothetical protein